MTEHDKPHANKGTSTPGSRAERGIVVVTGSSGMLGERVIDEFRHEYQVVGLDRDGQPQPPPEVECIVMEMVDPKSVALAFGRIAEAYGKHLAALVHLAAYVDFSEEDSPLYDTVTVQGTRCVLETMNDLEFTCERVVFSSTMLVHAPTKPGTPIDESHPLEAKWGYPQSKIDAERTILEAAGDTPTVFLRIAGVYTEDGSAPTIVQQIVRIAKDNIESHLLPGNPSHGQAFVHLDDTVEAIRRAVDKRAELPEHTVYLIGEPCTYSYLELQNTIASVLHGTDEWGTLEIPESVARVGAYAKQAAAVAPGVSDPFIKPFMIDMADDHYEIDITRANRDLGWYPEHRLIDVVPEMCRRFKQDPKTWRLRNGLVE